MSTKEFIQKIMVGEVSEAKDMLETMLNARAFETIEDRKHEIASTAFSGVSESVEEVEEQEEVVAQEEVEIDEEQLDELSRDTVDSYHKKVGDDINWRRADVERAQRKGDTETAKKEFKKLLVRKKGERRAMDRLIK